METLESWAGWAFMQSIGSYPGMEKILPALLNPKVFSGIFLRKVGLQPAFYIIILSVLADNMLMPLFEYAGGAYVAYSLFYNKDFYDLTFEGIYNTIWVLPLPDTVTNNVPGYVEYKQKLE